MFKYYNKEDKNTKRYVEDLLVFDHKFTIEDKYNIKNFIKTRRFILDSFPERYKNVFIEYLGLNGEKGLTQTEIAKKYNVSTERVRQWINDIIGRIANHETIFKAVCEFNDEYLMCKYNYDRYDLDTLKQLVLENDAELAQQRLAVLSTEKLEARILLDKILKLRLRDLITVLHKNNTLKFTKHSSIRELLNIRKEDFNLSEYKELVCEIHSIGLFFYDEFDYEEDWLNACYNGMISAGIKQVEQKLHIREDFDEISTKFNSIMATTIEDCNLSPRSTKALIHANIYTVGDLVKLTETKCQEIQNLGNKSFREIERKLISLGLEFCPNAIKPNEYIDKLARRFRINLQQKQINYETPKLNYDEDSEEFYHLLKTDIADLGLTNRAFNALQIANVKNVKDLVMITTSDLFSMKRIGRKSIEEIQRLASSLNLEFRNENIDTEHWLQELKNRYINKKKDVIEYKPKLDISEVPAEYRRIYAIGAMAEAKAEIDSVKTQDRLFSRAISSRINSKQHPIHVKVKQKYNDVKDFNVIEELRKNPENIIYLDENFIVNNRNELINIIKSSSFEQGKKEAMITIIENIMIYEK